MNRTRGDLFRRHDGSGRTVDALAVTSHAAVVSVAATCPPWDAIAPGSTRAGSWPVVPWRLPAWMPWFEASGACRGCAAPATGDHL